jgi:hypothetical protein
MAMAAFCVLMAALYLTQFPAIASATKQVKPEGRPDSEIWRHVSRFTLGQAACLLADITPEGEERVPWGDADGWYQALKLAIEGGEIKHEKTEYDLRHTFNGVYRPFEGTRISRESLKRFAEKRAVRPAFLRDD